jgi:hypothetical protein
MNRPKKRKKKRARNQYQQYAVLHGLCTQCHAKLDTDTQRCSKCAAKQRKLAAAYKLKNGDHLRRQARERTRRVRERVLAKYGGKCQCSGCGISQYEWLAIDHVDGGGCKERREKKFVNSQTFYNYLDKHRKLAKYQILCHNRNSANEFYGGCPHTRAQSPVPLVVIDGQLHVSKIYENLPQPHITLAA